MGIAPYLRRKGFDIVLHKSDFRYEVFFQGKVVARVDYVAVAHAINKENLFVDEILRKRPDLAGAMGIENLTN